MLDRLPALFNTARMHNRRPLPAGLLSGELRANRFVLIVLGLQRLSYLAPPLAGATAHGYRSTWLNIGLVAATVAWNIALFWRATRRGWFARWMVWTDVAWASLLLFGVRWNIVADSGSHSLNWSGRMGHSATALAGSALGPIPVAVAGVAVLLVAHAVVTIWRPEDPGSLATELVACLNGLLWFGVILGFAVRYLRRQGRLIEEQTARSLAAESRRAAEQARYSTRLTHLRALHDTVLTTLTAIARGGLDHRAEEVRRRCGRDAEYVRRMLTAVESDSATEARLDLRLSEAIVAAGALGLRVHHRRDPVPLDLPPSATAALGDAAREALNNVALHAGTSTAWLTVSTHDGAIIVRVEDHGRGFAPQPGSYGFGLRRSIVERMRGAGGVARVQSTPGKGTCVELTWRP